MKSPLLELPSHRTKGAKMWGQSPQTWGHLATEDQMIDSFFFFHLACKGSEYNLLSLDFASKSSHSCILHREINHRTSYQPNAFPRKVWPFRTCQCQVKGLLSHQMISSQIWRYWPPKDISSPPRNPRLNNNLSRRLSIPPQAKVPKNVHPCPNA